jgi:hypothetical protein
MTQIQSTATAINDQQERYYSHFQETMENVSQSTKEIYQAVVRCSTDLPGQVMLQQPVHLLDAKGFSLPFHLDFISSKRVR